MRRIAPFLLTAIMLAAVCARAGSVMVFAASSLTDCLQEIGRNWQSGGHDTVQFNFAASSFLARQIEEGAPADLFFSADQAKMDALAARGLVATNTRSVRLSNSLVVVVPLDSKLALGGPQALAGVPGKIALADPAAVPAGIYAKQWLEKLGLWSAVEPKVVPTASVRAALATVESGDADAAIVFKTDAAIAKKARVAFEARPEDSPEISYPVALLNGAKDPAAAKEFLNYLNGDAAGRVFTRFGFIVRGPSP